ncbi:MAG: aminotransferase class I/II-fold pyridoxal phosphate-dependent enzyme, partial [Hyphomicrobiales bacterium]|nr:aminotransferase class I/II-fold pyridoxal phosphate-dependent enzyme [Hyphomicrobiales bacterium]
KIDADRHVLPLAGSREGLFSAIFPAKQRKPAADRPAVLIPNPFYHTYAAAAGAAEIEAVFVPAPREAGFLPDLDGLDAALLDRTVALFLATPSNPEGAVADDAYLAAAIGLARAHDFMLFADECYSEIYADAPPPGALEVSAKAHGDLRNVISFNSLSKRSNLPGLRSGFCAGDPAFLGDYAGLRNVACPQLPLPIQHASARIWSDEAHVAQSRALYAEKLDIADRLLAGRYGYRRPQGGFFLWLDMSGHGGGEAATQTLWKECGVKVVPGGYLARDTDDGNPGADFVRVALVADVATTERGLRRIVETLQ